MSWCKKTHEVCGNVAIPPAIAQNNQGTLTNIFVQKLGFNAEPSTW